MPRCGTRLSVPLLSWRWHALPAARSCRRRREQCEGRSGCRRGAFNPRQGGRGHVGAQGLPYLDAQGRQLRRRSPLRPRAPTEAAGAEIRQPAESRATRHGPIVAKLEGTIVAANTASRAATIDVDVDGDGKADAARPDRPGDARHGAARQRSTSSTSTHFTNQIDFAQFGKSFNTHANTAVLAACRATSLTAGTVTSARRLSAAKLGHDLPLVTPAEADDRACAMSERPMTSSCGSRTSRRSIPAPSR